MKQGSDVRKRNSGRIAQKDLQLEPTSNLLEQCVRRYDALGQLINVKETGLERAPEGTLRIQKRTGYVQYYWRKEPNQVRGAYIKKDQRGIAEQLAQKDYDGKILVKLRKEYRMLAAYIDFLREKPLEELYNSYQPLRRELIHPVILPDLEYIAKWKSEVYERMGFADDFPEYYSNNGVRLRSKSEIIIANALEHYEIPYKYEYPLMLGNQYRVRPDFICLNVTKRKEYVWEHFGMMDNIAYANKNIQKLNTYEECGYLLGNNMIATFESSQQPLTSSIIINKIKQYLM